MKQSGVVNEPLYANHLKITTSGRVIRVARLTGCSSPAGRLVSRHWMREPGTFRTRESRR